MAERQALRGKLVVGQSGGCTHVINASLAGVLREARRRKGVTGVWGAQHGVEGILGSDLIDLDGVSDATVRALEHTPAAALGSCRRRISADESEAIVRLFRRNGVRYFVYIGGNDSAETAHGVATAAARQEYAMQVVSVPKTIDNDLPMTDHSPGFGSAGRFLASVVADVGLETEGMPTVEPVKVVEVMGRNAGWLAAAAALAKRSERDAPQIIWPPEVAFEARKFIRLVRRSLKRIGYCVVVASETIRDGRGRPVGAGGKTESDGFGHPRATGAAEYLCALVQERIKVRARWDKPGTIQRMSSAHLSQVDAREARWCGTWAVRFALQGRTDCMVIMRRRRGSYGVEHDTVALERIAGREKKLPASYFDCAKMLPTAAFRRYALPLIGPGLPEHPRLDGRPVRLTGRGRSGL